MEVAAAVAIGWVHVFSAVAWIGGVLFFVAVLRPALLKFEPDRASAVGKAVLGRFMPLAWTTIGLLLITGILRAVDRGAFAPKVLFGTPYGSLLLLKIGLVVAMVFVALAVSQSASRLLRMDHEGGSPEEAASIFGVVRTLSTANLLLGAIVIALAVALRVIGIPE